jgi:hypothetical protein
VIDPKGSSIQTDGERWLRHAKPDIRAIVQQLVAGELRPSELPMGDPRNAEVLAIWKMLRAERVESGWKGHWR